MYTIDRREGESDAQRFKRACAMATEVRHMSTKRTHTVVLSRNGVEIASKTTVYKRGKPSGDPLYTFA